jgi:hypothetical protein
MSRNTDLSTQTFHITNADDILSVEYENRVVLTASETFVPPAAATAIRFTAVGGGGAGIGTTGGAGAGLFQKTFYAPWVGVTTSFVLTIGAAEGDTTLADSAGTSLAKAFGATGISDTNPVGVGGTSCGGDLNTSGSPGGIGVGGASGGLIADSVYDDTYAGRWRYFQESITNENLKNYIISNFYISGGSENSIGIGTAACYTVLNQVIDGTATSSLPAGLFSNGFDSCSLPCSVSFTNAPGVGGKGGYGGNGGSGSRGQCALVGNPVTCGQAGSGGDGGYGGNGGNGGCFQRRCCNGPTIAFIGCPGGAGGYGGNGGRGGDGAGCIAGGYSCSGAGGAGGFGGHGGCGGCAGIQPCACRCCVTAAAGGAGGFGGGGGRGGNATFTMCNPGPGVCCSGTQGMGGCGGAGGYGGGGGGMGCSFCPAYTCDCISARSGAGGAGAIIVEWTTKKVTN